MPNFTARIIEGNAGIVPWDDPAAATGYCVGGNAPSRINPRPEQRHSYWKKIAPGSPTTMVFGATVPGLGDRPLDAALGGNLFTWSWVEHAGLAFAITPTALKSSEASFVLEVGTFGHYVILCTRANGGAVAIPFTIEP